MPDWWNGRHGALKMRCLWRAGSSPASGTSDKTLYDVVEGLSVLREQSSACVLKSHSRPSYVPYRVWCGELDTVIWCEHVTTCTLSCNLRMPCWNIAFPTVEPVDKPCVRMVLRGEFPVIDNTFPKIEWNQAISTKNVGIPTFLGCG